MRLLEIIIMQLCSWVGHNFLTRFFCTQTAEVEAVEDSARVEEEDVEDSAGAEEEDVALVVEEEGDVVGEEDGFNLCTNTGQDTTLKYPTQDKL